MKNYSTYVLLQYSPGSHGIDRWGNRYGQESSFKIQFYKDQNEFINDWAKLKVFDTPDSIDDLEISVIINGVPEDHLNEEEFDDYLILEKLMLKQKQYFIERNAIKKLEDEAVQQKINAANEAANEAAKIAKQHAHDLYSFNLLKVKLGL